MALNRIGIFIILLCGSIYGQSVTVEGVTATQAKISVAAENVSLCTIKLSKSTTLTPLVYDLDGALFTNAQNAHVLTGAGVAGKREMLIGQRVAAKDLNGRWDSRALATNTQYFGEASVCVTSPVAFNFTTGVTHGSGPQGYPIDSTAWGNQAFPEFDFTDLTKPVVDPQTGIEIYSADPSQWSSNTVLPVVSGFTLGGTGWTNFANLISYSSAVATTGNTNTATLLINTAAYNVNSFTGGGNWPYDNILDIGLELYGSGSDASATNRTVRACLTVDSQTCFTDYVTLALPQTTNAAAGVMPSSYPATYFRGWSKRLPRKQWVQSGSVTATTGTVTLTKDADGAAIPGNRSSVSYFNPDWVSGTKIYIAGSSGTCTNNLCTISSVTDGAHLVLVENLTLGENLYQAGALGVIINKTNATGTVNVSARFRIAQGWPNDIWTGGCASTTVTSGDGITGYPCVFPKVRQDSGALYFVGVSTPVIRLISLFPNRGCSPCNVADSPNGAISVLGPTTPGFDPADPSYMYTTSTTNSAGPALFKAHYTGNWSALNISYTSSGSNPPVTTELSWENMTRSETAHDISTQILANTTYNATIFPALTGVIQAGYSNGLIFYTIQANGQDTPGWIFAFTASTGNFYRAWNTYDGVGVPELKYGGLHAGSPIDDGGILASLHLLSGGNPTGTANTSGTALTWVSGTQFDSSMTGLYIDINSVTYTVTFVDATHLTLNTSAGTQTGVAFTIRTLWLVGPFQSTIATVKKAGVFNADTRLPWPPDSTYDQACPMAYPNGTDGCFTFRAPSPCSVTPHTGEAAIYACDHGSGLSMISTYTVGDWFKAWLPSEAGSDRDAEGFKVVQVTDLGGGNKEVVAWRNAPYSYCAIGKDGVNGAAQNVHSNVWVLFMTPAEACAAGLTLVDSTGGSTGLAYPVNNQSTRGHFAMAKTGTKQSTLTGIGGSGDIYGVEYQRAWSNILQRFDFSVPTSPKFSGASSAFATQSYADAKQFNANADLKRYVFDFRHFNGNTGLELEYPGQTIGTATASALQGGTTSVYKVTVTGTVDVKRGQITAWAGDTLLRDISNATTSSHQITDATPLRWCYAYNAGECRTGSSQGDFYMSVPGMTSKTSCWASQINLRVLCAMTGPVQATNATQVLGSQADPDGINQRLLGHILMGPGHQYVYSNLLATPAAEYLMFGGYLTSGYHTALMMAKLPPYNADSNTRNQFIPIKQIGTCTSCYIRFGYQEFGDPLTGQFYATSRAEETRVAASAIVAATPFKFASEALSAASGSYTIQIPALPGFTLFWQLVDNGVPGALNSVLVN